MNYVCRIISLYGSFWKIAGYCHPGVEYGEKGRRGRDIGMAHIIKEHSTLQDQSKRNWTILGIVWIVALLTLLLPIFVKGALGIYFVPLVVIGVAAQLTWKSMIIIRGNIGEKRVFRELKELPEDYYILNDVTVKVDDKEAQIDHLVVSSYGLWCVETKSHFGRIS